MGARSSSCFWSILLIVGAGFGGAFFSGVASAQWMFEGTPVAVGSGYQTAIATDAQGNAILVWVTESPGYDIYAQRLDTAGIAQWASNGIPVCRASGLQLYPKVVLDGTGNATIAWLDDRNPGARAVYAQRIDSSGHSQWAADGIALSSAVVANDGPVECSDGAGGAVVAWVSGESNDDVYAQRIDPAGTLLWGPTGSRVIAGSFRPYQSRKIVTDGSGGAIVSWADTRTPGGIWAQHIGSSGSLLWAAEGVRVTTSDYGGGYHDMAPDGQNGAVIVWIDFRLEPGGQIYTQRLGASGARLWGGDGVAVSSFPAGDQNDATVAEVAGGAIVAWGCRIGGPGDPHPILAQKISSSGALEWGASGVVLANVAGSSNAPASVIPDQSGGAIVAWNTGVSVPTLLFAQRVNADGSFAWQAGGLRLTPATPTVLNTPVAASDAFGGIVAAWKDGRGALCAERIQASGEAGPIDNGRLVVVSDVPMDEGGWVRLELAAPALDWAGGATPGFRPSSCRVRVRASACRRLQSWSTPHSRISGYYKLSATDRHGNESGYALLTPRDIAGTGTPSTLSPSPYLSRVSPSPFAARTSVEFGLAIAGPLALTIHDVRGRLLRTIASGIWSAGPHRVQWDGQDAQGQPVADGIYFVRLELPGRELTQKVIVARSP